MRNDFYEMMDPAFDVMNEMMRGFFGEPRNHKKVNFYPSVFGTMKTDISETDTEYSFEIELPGYDKEDIKIVLENEILKISAEKEETKENVSHKERYVGKIYREYYVGKNIDESNIKAKMDKGILEISIPKKVAETKNNKIEIE